MMHETMDTFARNDVLELTGASSLTARRFRPPAILRDRGNRPIEVTRRQPAVVGDPIGTAASNHRREVISRFAPPPPPLLFPRRLPPRPALILSLYSTPHSQRRNDWCT